MGCSKSNRHCLIDPRAKALRWTELKGQRFGPWQEVCQVMQEVSHCPSEHHHPDG